MADLNTDSRLPDPDAAYRALIEAHRALSDEASAALNSRLVLILANHIGDPEVLADMLAGAISGCAGGPLASIALGASSFSAQKGRSFQWLPRSDMVPLPKSHQRYHLGPGK